MTSSRAASPPPFALGVALAVALVAAGCVSHAASRADEARLDGATDPPLPAIDPLQDESPDLRGEFDWESAAMASLAQDARALNGSDQTQKGIEFADHWAATSLQARADGNLSMALELEWRAYATYYAVANGFGGPSDAQRAAAVSRAEAALDGEADNITREIDRARGLPGPLETMEDLAQAELSVLDARSIADHDRPGRSGAYNVTDPWGLMSAGGEYGKAARREVTARYWLDEAARSRAGGRPVTWTERTESDARSFVESARAAASATTSHHPQDALFAHYASDTFVWCIDGALERGWIEGALEAAFRADASLRVVESLEPGYEEHDDVAVAEAWNASVAAPLGPSEATEAAFVGEWLTTFDQSHSHAERLGVEALVLALREHREERGRLMPSP